MDTTGPAILTLQQPQAERNIVVPTLNVTFSKAINPTTFTAASSLVGESDTLAPDWPTPVDGLEAWPLSTISLADLCKAKD
jgi:hypothetical protein